MGTDAETPTSNRLANERSPYLKQHAHNPVDWFPWGDEALERARAEDRPILLSIGYSACHWCHVMEHESFDDADTAAQMNRDFVNIKVDREERPDLDSIYMAAVQSLTGRGGWPMTVFLTPTGEPFYGGTYFPPEPRPGMPAFRQVLSAVADAWRDRRDEVLEGAERIRKTLEAGVQGDGRAAGARPELSSELLTGAVQVLESSFDPADGGFGGAPKFPQPVTLEFLLGRWAAAGDDDALRMATTTLKRMAAGGMRDHLGGGFHRYSVDAKWRVPHFEKMLYDNALLARVYLDGWRATGDEMLLRVARSTLDYLRRDLLAPEGGFWSARDADSEGEEGLFYLWTPQQVAEIAAATATDAPSDEAIDEDAVALFCRLYDVTPGGNFPEGPGGAIPWLGTHGEAVAAEIGEPLDALLARVAPLRAALLKVREEREPPFLDTKILCAWSAFAVEAFAESTMTDEPQEDGTPDPASRRADDLQIAIRGARFLLDAMRVQGRLHRVFSHGEPRIPGFLEDHAALGNALLTLHEATLDPGWLPDVRWCVEEILERFFDADSRTLWDAPSDGESLVVRPRDLHDGATPSGNALAVELLLRAGHLFDEPEWISIARDVLADEAGRMTRYPSAFGRLLRQVERALARPVEVAILGPEGAAREALRDAARVGLHPNRTLSGGDPAQQELSGYPLLKDRGDAAGEPQAFLCRDYACDAPTLDPDELRTRLKRGG